MTLVLGKYEELIPEGYHIEYWYDRHQHYWVIQVFDNHDIEHHCEVGVRRGGLAQRIIEIKEEYGTDSITKL